MPTTYLQTLAAVQQRGLAAIKAAQEVHLAALRIMRDSAATPAAGLPFTQGVAECTLGFGYQIAAQNAAYALALVEALAPPTAVAEFGTQAELVISEAAAPAIVAPDAPASPDRDDAGAPVDTLARMLPPPRQPQTVPSVSGNFGPKPVGKTKSKRSK